jgi:hypothetical protein
VIVKKVVQRISVGKKKLKSRTMYEKMASKKLVEDRRAQ